LPERRGEKRKRRIKKVTKVAYKGGGAKPGHPVDEEPATASNKGPRKRPATLTISKGYSVEGQKEEKEKSKKSQRKKNKKRRAK